MRFMQGWSWKCCAVVVAMGALSACGGVTSGSECASDTDCKGDRICNTGHCMAPDGGGSQDGTVGGGDGEQASPEGSTSMDGYAPLPHQPGNASFTAIYAPSQATVYRPLFSEPSCDVVPPYGQYYEVVFAPRDAGPTGTFAECVGGPQQPRCANVNITDISSGLMTEAVDGGMYTLSDFDNAGIATGKMDTAQGIVQLIVKMCP
jgi:hypothetical protein